MSARATWKGLLQISLVTVPIKVFPATEASESLSFHQLHSDCQTRMTSKKWCAACNQEVPNADIVKGFEFEKGKYVLLLPEDLDAVQPPSTRIIDLVQFVPLGSLDQRYIDRPYYLAPDGPAAGSAYRVIALAMGGMYGIGKLAIYGREYLVAVRAFHHGLLLYTLRHAGEVRELEALEAMEDCRAAPVDQVKLAEQVIHAFTRPLDLADFTDAYQADVRRLIDAKIAGHEIVVPVLPSTVALTLEEALQKSLQMVKVSIEPKAPKRKRA